MKNKFIAGIAVYIIVVLMLSQIKLKWDFTEDQRFTLSPSSLTVLQNVDSTVTIEIFLTGELPQTYKKLSRSCAELMQVFKQINPSKINIIYRNPLEELINDSLKQAVLDSLYNLGLPIESVTQKNTNSSSSQLVIPGALVYYRNYPPVVLSLKNGRVIYKLIDIFNDIQKPDEEATQNEAATLLENKFIQAIYALTKPTVPIIGIVVGNDEAPIEQIYDLFERTKKFYQLAFIDLKKGFPNPKILNTLLIIKPIESFSENEKYKLDQYILHGGNVIWAIDYVYAELDGLKNSGGSYLAYPYNLNLDDLFFTYGIRYNQSVVLDLNCAKLPVVIGKFENDQPNIQRFPWPYFPLLSAVNKHPIVHNLDKVLALFPGSLDTIKTPELKKTILLATDTNSYVLASPALIKMQPVQSEQDFAYFNRHHIPIAVLVEGKCKSLYAYRQNPQLNDSILQQTKMTFLSKAVVPSKQVFLSDADILTNSATDKGYEHMGRIPHEEYTFANAQFYLNVLDYFTADIPIYESRNKSYILRLLDKEKIEKNRLFWQIMLIFLPIIFFIGLNFLIVKYQTYLYTKNINFK